MKNVLIFVLTGALLGGLAASFIGRGMAVWYASPATAGAMCPCESTIKEAAGTMMKVQFIGVGLGALVFLIFGILIFRKRGHPQRPGTVPPTAAAT